MAKKKEGGMSQVLSLINTDELDRETGRIIALGRVLDEFRKRGLNMPVAQIQAFLIVCLDQGLGMSEIASATDTKDSTTSRYLLEMGPHRVPGDSNMQLVERSVDPMDTRRARYKLTKRGKALCDAICAALSTEGL